MKEKEMRGEKQGYDASLSHSEKWAHSTVAQTEVPRERNTVLTGWRERVLRVQVGLLYESSVLIKMLVFTI